MSFQQLRRAFAADTPTAPARLVLLELANFATDSGEAWPSLPTLAGRTGLSVRAVRDAIRRLEAAGLLTTTERRGRNVSNLYRLTLDGGANRTPAVDASFHEKPAGDAAQTGRRCRSKPAGDAANPISGTSQRTCESTPPPESPTAARAREPAVGPGGGGGHSSGLAHDPGVVVDDLDGLLVEITRAARLDPFDPDTARTWRGEGARTLARCWLEAGLNAEEICAVVGETAPPTPPSTPNYFAQPMHRAAQTKASGAKPGESPAQRRARERLERDARIAAELDRRHGYGTAGETPAQRRARERFERRARIAADLDRQFGTIDDGG